MFESLATGAENVDTMSNLVSMSEYGLQVVLDEHVVSVEYVVGLFPEVTG